MAQFINNKIAGYTTKWAQFPGFSLLFDNSGTPFIKSRDRLDLSNDICQDPNQQFYSAIAQAVQEIGEDSLALNFGAHVLTPGSYHATALDGGNKANLNSATESVRAALATTLENITTAFPGDDPIVRAMAESQLCKNKNWSITFKLKALEYWGQYCILCVLEPADNLSRQRLTQFEECRVELSDSLEKQFGITRYSFPYTPHITVAYFASGELKSKIEDALPDWQGIVASHVGDLTLTFDSISVYGFSDMITFFTTESLFNGSANAYRII